MDLFLENQEKWQLLELLEVPHHSFNNLPIMRTAYKRACKKYHPDKGGDSSKMMCLNGLWQKYQDGVLQMRSFPEVCAPPMNIWDACLQDYFSASLLKELMLKGPQCLTKGTSTCACIASTLINQHYQYKELLNKRCLVWGECFCIFCFALWYGLAYSWETFEVWAAVISQMPKSLLHLKISKYFSFFFALQ